MSGDATTVPPRPEAHSEAAHALLAARVPAAFDEAVQPVPSPCISICRMNADRILCTGCYRSLDEIRAWSGAGPGARRATWRLLLARAGLYDLLKTLDDAETAPDSGS